MRAKRLLMLLGSVCLALMLVVPMVAACAAPTPTPELIELKMADFLPRTHEMSAYWVVKFIEKVEELTNGRVKITHHDAGSLVKGPEMLDAIKMGVTDQGNLVTSFFPDQLPLCAVTSLPYICDNPEQASWVFWKLTQEGPIREEIRKQGIVPLCSWVDAGRLLWFTSPVSTLEELQTKKMRAMATEAKILNAMGVSAVSLGGGEWQEAMRTGVVDGVSQSYWCVKGFSIDELATDGLWIGMYTMGSAIIPMNEDSWNSLPVDIQEAMIEAGEWASEYFPAVKRAECDQIGKDALKAAGITVRELSAEDMAKVEELISPVVDEWLEANGESGAALMEQIENLKETYNKEH